MEYATEIIIAIIGLFVVSTLVITITINKNANKNNKSITQIGDNPKAYMDSTMNNSKDNENEK